MASVISNSGALAGRTIFITGASRGIGKAIALKAARDGANVVIAAKTSEPHPKLPGTIHSAAAEVEAAGGKALACVVDIRDETAVQSAVDQAVAKFGGIDILVNNASAISLTNTLNTSMKTFDLMMSINARGTYLCSKLCLPHLVRGKQPHILNISPPLNMKPHWFENHTAYTMAKYGMSMCVLGMSPELTAQGVAVNALWPRTAIYTAAMKMLAGSSKIAESCRTPEIMSDAAYVMLCKDKSFTGNFCIDDEVLQAAGMRQQELDGYSCHPGAKLMPDFFLDVVDSVKTPAEVKKAASASSHSQVASTWSRVESLLNEDTVAAVNGCIEFRLNGAEAGTWRLEARKGAPGRVLAEPFPAEDAAADTVMTLDSDDFLKLFAGKLSATAAFMQGKLKISGNMGAAMRLEKLMKQMPKAKL